MRRESTCITRSISRGATDDRVELLLAGELGEVATELVEHERAGGLLLGAGGTAPAGGAGLLGAAAGALVAGEELDDLLADPGQVGAELHEHLGGDALALADQPEEDVLGADVVVAELQRLAERQLEDLLGAGRERDVPGRRRAALPDDLLDLAAHGLERDAERLEGLGGDAFALVDQPEQDVLGADVVVVEEPSFLLGEHDDPSGPVGEPFEQVSLRPVSGGSVGRVYPRPPASLPSPVPGVQRQPSAGFRPSRGRPVACGRAQPARSASRAPRSTGSGSRTPCCAVVAAEDELMAQMGGHLIPAGGKRQRPLFAACAPPRPPPAADDAPSTRRHRRRDPRAASPSSSSRSARCATTT